MLHGDASKDNDGAVERVSPGDSAEVEKPAACRPVPAPPHKSIPAAHAPIPRVSGREREVQQLIYDLALLAAGQRPQPTT